MSQSNWMSFPKVDDAKCPKCGRKMARWKRVCDDCFKEEERQFILKEKRR